MSRHVLALMISGLVALCSSACLSRDVRPPDEKGLAIGECNPLPCAHMKVDEPPVLPELVPVAVRERIAAQIAEVLYAPLDDASTEFSRESLRAQMEARLKEFVTEELSSAPLDWTLERKATVLFANDAVLTVDVANTGYLGGAHGFNERTLLCFALADGRRLTLTEIINPDSKGILQQVAEAEFRRVRGISSGRSLQDEGFFVVPGEPFGLADNFGVVADGILLHYNPYDIGPYFMGETDVVLPREAVAPLLKDGELRVAHLFDSTESKR